MFDQRSRRRVAIVVAALLVVPLVIGSVGVIATALNGKDGANGDYWSCMRSYYESPQPIIGKPAAAFTPDHLFLLTDGLCSATTPGVGLSQLQRRGEWDQQRAGWSPAPG